MKYEILREKTELLTMLRQIILLIILLADVVATKIITGDIYKNNAESVVTVVKGHVLRQKRQQSARTLNSKEVQDVQKMLMKILGARQFDYDIFATAAIASDRSHQTNLEIDVAGTIQYGTVRGNENVVDQYPTRSRDPTKGSEDTEEEEGKSAKIYSDEETEQGLEIEDPYKKFKDNLIKIEKAADSDANDLNGKENEEVSTESKNETYSNEQKEARDDKGDDTTERETDDNSEKRSMVKITGQMERRQNEVHKSEDSTEIRKSDTVEQTESEVKSESTESVPTESSSVIEDGGKKQDLDEKETEKASETEKGFSQINLEKTILNTKETTESNTEEDTEKQFTSAPTKSEEESDKHEGKTGEEDNKSYVESTENTSEEVTELEENNSDQTESTEGRRGEEGNENKTETIEISNGKNAEKSTVALKRRL